MLSTILLHICFGYFSCCQQHDVLLGHLLLRPIFHQITNNCLSTVCCAAM